MRVAVAFDHRGVKLRERVLSVVAELGHEAVDLGTAASEPRVDYPDKAQEVGDAIRSGAAELVRTFLQAEFDGGERYVKRLEKVARMEKELAHGEVTST